MENEEIKKTYLSAFQRFYQDIGETWSRAKVENVLKIFERHGNKYSLRSPEIKKVLNDLESESWLQVVGKDDVYIVLNKEKFQ
jgi:hypothetical protein